jgi:hypothetical protein
MARSFVRVACLFACLAVSPWVMAQEVVIRNDELLRSDRPEAWAMRYMTAATLMTSFGPVPALAPGEWQVAGELGEIPHLDAAQRQVGFQGTKAEDLNKSPLTGRIRGWIGLPGGFVAELGWVPPVEIDGAKPRDLFSAAIGKRFVDAHGYTLSARVFGQHGAATGDITCPSDLVGIADPEVNPYGCEIRPSSDTLEMNYYGIDTTFAYATGPWTFHGTGGLVQMENTVQVDARVNGYRDYSYLVAHGHAWSLAAGVGRELGAGWHLAAEVLYVPLTVLRDPDGSSDNDPMLSWRLQLRYRFTRE